jgi:hypothetical protein
MQTPYIHERILFPAVEGNPRNGEGDAILLADGRLLLVYGEFLGGSDSASATLQAVTSPDRGRTWTDKHTLQENTGALNVMSASLLRMRNGELLLSFLRKDGHLTQCTPFARRSADEGRTWSPPEAVIPPDPAMYYVVNNARTVLLRTGRILMPACLYAGGQRAGDRVFHSDDHARTWRASPLHPLDSNEHGPLEPGVVELRDGRVLMWCRTGLKDIYACLSDDGGERFGPWRPLGLPCPNAPASIKRLPSTGNLLCLFNSHAVPRQYWAVDRSPLTAALSSDEGLTWRIAGDLEPDRTRAYCYTSITFLPAGEILLTYYQGRTVESVLDGQARREHHNLSHLKIALLQEDWLTRPLVASR